MAASIPRNPREVPKFRRFYKPPNPFWKKKQNVMSYDNPIILYYIYIYHTISIYIPMTLWSVTWLGNSIRSSLAPHLKRNMNIATVRSLMTTSSILIIWRCLNGSLKWDSSSSVGSWCFRHFFSKWQTQIIGWVTQTKHILNIYSYQSNHIHFNLFSHRAR